MDRCQVKELRKLPLNGLIIVLPWEGTFSSNFILSYTYSCSTLTSPIITLVVGPESRLFACHEEILTLSPFFAAIVRGQFLESSTKRVNLPDEIPEVFSSVLEYLYKGDYYPKLMHNKRTNSWELEDAASNKGGKGTAESTVYHPELSQMLLKGTKYQKTSFKGD
jgi:hypothetical protein